MPRINSFRIQSKNIFLTYPNCPLPKNECLNLLLRLNYAVKPYYIRVCAEHHSNGTPHLHCLLQFTSKFQTTNFNFFDLVSQHRSHHFHPNVQAARNAAAVQSYISKGGDFCEHGTFTESSNPRVSGQGINAIYKAALATKNRDVAFQMLSDADTKYFFGNYDRLCHNWARMFKAPPEEYVSPYAGQFNNVPVDLQEWARDNIRDPAHRTYRPRSIVIEGPTRIGKTLWARSLGPHNHYAGHLDMAKHSNDAYYNIVDDVPPKFLKHWRELFGSQVHWQSNCKYHKPIEICGGIPTIFLCNPGTETSYKYYIDNHPDPGLKAWTLANADFFFVTESFFTTIVGPKMGSIIREDEAKEVPSWQKQLTFRAFFVSFVLGILFSVIVMKLSLTSGIIPSLNVSAGLLGFFFVKTWTKFLGKSGLLQQPFTRQENTVIQTCVVASSGIAFSGGSGSYLLGMSEMIFKQASEANDVQDFKNPSLGWIIGFLFIVSFFGLFSVLPLRKMMIIDYKLIYPSGTAIANLINILHTPQGSKLAKKQAKALGKIFSFSFLWGFFQWFFTAGDDCGFVNFPTFGLKAFENKFYFDFSATYVGVGMICPYITNVSLLLGSILSWGVMWPLIESRKGEWFSRDLSPSSLHGIQGYRVFISIALLFGDGIYIFFKVLSKTVSVLANQPSKKDPHWILPVADQAFPEAKASSFDDHSRTQLFLKDQIPTWLAVSGYVTIVAISTATLPQIFPQMEWYYVLAVYIIAPTFAFCNAYGCGLTDSSLDSTYGKLVIFTIGAWAGKDHGGVLAGLAACGVMMNIVTTASDLMQDFKTGYMTLASPRSSFASSTKLLTIWGALTQNIQRPLPLSTET